MSSLAKLAAEISEHSHFEDHYGKEAPMGVRVMPYGPPMLELSYDRSSRRDVRAYLTKAQAEAFLAWCGDREPIFCSFEEYLEHVQREQDKASKKRAKLLKDLKDTVTLEPTAVELLEALRKAHDAIELLRQKR